MAASDSHPSSRRLYVTDRTTKVDFLIDTGADLCVYPRSLTSGPHKKIQYSLTAANGTSISTFGTITLCLNLGLRREFTWKFVIADVSKPIIGADFLHHYHLIVDLTKQQLVDGTTQLTTLGEVIECTMPSIKTVCGSTKYHNLLQCFPNLTRPDGMNKTIRHNTLHHIVTTPGPPVALRPRRLAPDRLAAAKRSLTLC